MRTLLLLSSLVLSPRETLALPAHAALTARVSVQADSNDTVNAAIMADLAAAFAQVAKRHGYDRAKGVPGWLEAPYLASASTRPDVPEFFESRKAYAEDLSAHIDTIAMVVVGRRLKSMGLNVTATQERREAFLYGFKKSDAKLRAMLGAMRRQSIVALRLHEFLVEVDSHVRVNPKDPETVLFDRPVDQRRYLEIATAVDAANEQVAKATASIQATASTQR